MVEFTLVSFVFLAFILSIMDFGYLFFTRIQVFQEVRAAARYAAVNPTAWTNAATPGANSIEGHLRITDAPGYVPNNDAHITISYWVNSTNPVQCGSYSAATNSFVAANGYTKATCLVPGNMIQVKAIYNYSFITPILRAFAKPDLTATAWVEEEVAGT
jgi:Flp pilus assembly protein TadG